MSQMKNVLNTVTRRLEFMFPGYFPGVKHNHYADFGYPDQLTFSMFYNLYCRNGIARAGIERSILKTWQSNPELWETEKPEESPTEAEIRQHFSDIRFWQKLAEADRRSLVGGYSGLILRIADGLNFDQPLGTVLGGLPALVDVIPVWAGQLTVSEWYTDLNHDKYGQPKMFAFKETMDNRAGAVRSFMVHPDRVLIWSADGSLDSNSALSAGYNDLLDMEKIKGAGGEGFWKNAKSSPVLEIDKDARLVDMAKAMGVAVEDVATEMNNQVESWQQGFDKLLMLQGMKASTLGVTLPNPDPFFGICVQSFAASIPIPMKILLGSQTGERASTEDADEWNNTNMSRRNNCIVPLIMELVKRLESCNILPEADWILHWEDLTETSVEQKLERADRMATINQKMGEEPAFLVDEIRAAVDLDPSYELQRITEEETE